MPSLHSRDRAPGCLLDLGPVLRPAGGGAWTPVGSYEGARGCRAMRREIVARYRRRDVTAMDADTVRIKDPLGWWLTYTCRPGGAPPR